MRLLALLLIAEGTWSAFSIATLLPTLAIYPGRVVALLALRAAVAAAECSGGWSLATHGRAGPALARWALAASAILTTFEVGWRLTPTDLWPGYRWYYVCGYWLYAAAAGGYLYARRDKFER